MKDIDEIRRLNLKLVEKEAGGPAEAARLVAMSLAQFANLRDGAKDSKTGKPRGMRKETARRIEVAAGKPEGWLDTEHNANGNAVAPATPAAAPHATADEVVIVQYDISGGMDTRGRLVLDGETSGEIKSWRVDREWLRVHVPVYTSLQNLCIVTGFGPSMKPMFNPGDPLLMDRGVKLVDHEGIYFFRIGDQGYIKIIQRVPNFDKPGFVLRIHSKNKEDFPPYDISPANPDFHVIGKILTVWKSEQY
ncbi:S24 family peptidase [Variovorax sp. EBFNA2]|uniref:S24 family peptidase n=1 Tax=Variovorax sp. EBFNA2 TaxID=3342097 RepID=UPI0029C051C7|nr:S24 family peptidase [Variovorax boronicumulans]WPG35335.1 S24 family peptidase [Variovorax boronicumulans]